MEKIFEGGYDKNIIKLLKSGYGIDAEYLTYIPIDEDFQLVIKLPDTFSYVDDLGDGQNLLSF